MKKLLKKFEKNNKMEKNETCVVLSKMSNSKYFKVRGQHSTMACILAFSHRDPSIHIESACQLRLPNYG